jgi:hypothetical protein
MKTKGQDRFEPQAQVGHGRTGTHKRGGEVMTRRSEVDFKTNANEAK